MNAVKHVDKRNLSVMPTLIVPDRASLEAERQLLTAIGGSFNAQVRTFRRLANDILPKYQYLSKQAGIMALGSIIQDNKDRLTCYTKGVDTSGFVADMYDTISMMKYCRISPSNLINTDLPKSVQNKAHDIAVLYEAYLDYTANNFVDSADKMDLLCENIKKSQVVANSYFYLYDFDNLSAQELAIVEQLVKYSQGVTVACCVGKRAVDKYLYIDDIYNGVMGICKQCGITPNVVEGEKYSNKYVEQIGRNLYRYIQPQPVACDNFVEIYQGSTRAQEVYALACRIQNYVRKGGRFKDVYVVTSDVNRYFNSVSTVFDEFEIPYFCDRQFALSAHPYARYVMDYLSLCRNNGNLNYVLPFVKNYLFVSGLAEDERDDVYLFENYCLKYNVNYRYDNFTLGKTEQFYDKADNLRAKFDKLYKTITVPQTDTVSNYVNVVRQLIDYVKLEEVNGKFADEQQNSGLEFESKVTRQVADKFEQVLCQAENVLGNRKVKLEEFIKTLTMGVDAVKISVIPVSNDCVIFANMAKARKHDVKFLALLGANYGAMPIVKKDCKLLTDANLKDLVASGINVEPQIFVENKRERFSLYQLLQEPTDKLYVSYAETDGGDALAPSPFVEELCNMFKVGESNLAVTDVEDEDVYTQKQALSKVIFNHRRLQDNQVVKMPAYTVLAQRYKDKLEQYAFCKNGKDVCVSRGGELYLKNSTTSVSQLTDFFKCPYRFYLQYGLNVKPRSVAEFQTADLGNILHNVLETYVNDKDMRVDESDDVTRQIAKRCFENALNDDFYKGLRSDIQMQGTIEQLERECLRLCVVVKKQLVSSDFTNLDTEISFGEKTDAPVIQGKDGFPTVNGKVFLKPVQVEFEGGKFNLKGKIDRVDVHGDRFIVIDYKSGASAAHYGEKDLYLGHKLQLLVYVKAVLNYNSECKTQYRPAGFYYFNIHDNFSQEGKDKVYFYKGRTLNDLDVACAIDKELKTGVSAKLGMKVSKDGSKIDGSCQSLLTDEQFDNQIEYAFRLISKAGDLMQKGYASVNPYDGACSYCDYKDVCYFNDVSAYDARKVTERIYPKNIDETVKK